MAPIIPTAANGFYSGPAADPNQAFYDAQNARLKAGGTGAGQTIPTQVVPPAASTTASSQMGAGNLVNVQNKLDTAITAGSKQVTPTTPTTPTTPQVSATPLPKTATGGLDVSSITPTTALDDKQFQALMTQTGNNTTGWTKDASGNWTPSGVNLAQFKSQALIQEHVAPQLQGISGVNATTLSDGSISITTSSGQPITLDVSKMTNPDGSVNTTYINEAAGAVKTAEQTASTVKTAAENRLTQLKAQKATQQAALDKQKSTALANAKAAMAAANPYGAPSSDEAMYTDAINQQYAVQQQALDTAYTAAESQVSSDSAEAVSKAYADLNSSVTDIMDKAQTASTQQRQFAFQTQQKSLTDFTTLTSKFDTSSLPKGTELSSLTLGTNGKTGVPQIDALISQAVKGGLTPEAALGFIQGQTLSQNKADQTTFVSNLKNFNLPDVSKMSLAEAQKNPLISGFIDQGARVFGSKEAGFQAIQQSFSQQKQELDIQKEQMAIQRASVSVQNTLANLQVKALTAGSEIMRKQVVTAAKKDTPFGNLVNAAGVASDVEAIKGTIEQAMIDSKSSNPKVRANASSVLQANTAKLFDLSARVFTGRSVTQGQIKLEEAAQSFPDSIKAQYNSFAGKGPSIASPEYTKALYSSLEDVLKDKASNPTAVQQYKMLQETADDLTTKFPSAAPEIQGYVPQVQTFIDKYGKQDTKTYKEGDVYNYNNITYKLINGTWTPQK